GGTAAIQNKIQLAVAEANDGYVNSGVLVNMTLVGTMEVAYTESGSLDTDLNALQSGAIAGVAAARNSLGADLVSMWIDFLGMSGGVVGLGFQLDPPINSSFAPYAYSVVEGYWAPGPGYAFAHEMGHNMGAAHDRAHASAGGAYSYSYGLQHPGSPAFRTIMAYPCSGNCPIINYWSNPSVLYQGAATGIDDASASAADNAHTLNNTRTIVAAFKAASSGCTYSLHPTGPSPGSGASSNSVGVTAGTGCNWTAITTTSWITINSGSSGSGNGSVGYSVTANPSSSQRSGSITIAGQTFSVTQSGAAPSTISVTV